MLGFRFVSLAVLALQAALVRGQDDAEPAENAGAPPKQPTLAVTVSTNFPSSEIFGVKLVNGVPTEAQLTFTNDEPEPVIVNFVGGSLWTPESPGNPAVNVRNLTTAPFGLEIPPATQKTVSYKFATEMHPQELTLNLLAIVGNGKGQMFTLPAYNQPVSIVEPDTSIFDPQIIFLYVFLLASFVGVMYFFYSMWIAPYFPKRKPTKAADGKKTARREAAEPTSPAAGPDAGVAKTYDAEWIPAHHIQTPQARKVKGSIKSKTRS